MLKSQLHYLSSDNRSRAFPEIFWGLLILFMSSILSLVVQRDWFGPPLLSMFSYLMTWFLMLIIMGKSAWSRGLWVCSFFGPLVVFPIYRFGFSKGILLVLMHVIAPAALGLFLFRHKR